MPPVSGHDAGGRTTTLNQALYLSARDTLPNYILNTLGDRIEMAHSVEARVPFLDHHLVDYVKRVPPRLKIRPDTLEEKWILRPAVRPVITDTVYRRQKLLMANQIRAKLAKEAENSSSGANSR